MNMKIICLVSLLAFNFIGPVGMAGESEAVYPFVDDYVESLSLFHKAAQLKPEKFIKVKSKEVLIPKEVISVPSDENPPQEPSDSSVAEIEEKKVSEYQAKINFDDINKDLVKAKEKLKKYIQTEDELVKTILAGTFMAYQAHMRSNLRGLDFIDQLYNVKATETFDMQAFIEGQKKVDEDKEQATKLLNHCAVLITHLLVSETPDAEGNMSILAITTKERKKLMKKLQKEFGEQIFEGLTDQVKSSAAPAAAIFDFLMDSERSALDEIIQASVGEESLEEDVPA